MKLNVATKFQHQLLILTFWTKFAQKAYFRWKQKSEQSPLNSAYWN